MAVSTGTDKQRDFTAFASDRSEPFDDSPRGRLLTAMAEVVAHGGYREATVDRVLEQARVGWSEFIELFPDLDACFLATLDAAFESAATRADVAAAGCGPSADLDTIFEAALRAVLDAAAAHPDVAGLCLVEGPALGAPALERRRRGLQLLVDTLEGHLGRSGSGTRAFTGLAAEMVVGGVYEVVADRARAGEVERLPALADELTRLWLPALRAA